MKKLLLALIVIIMSIFFCSCDDIVNIGNPQKQLIDNHTPYDSIKTTIFDVENKKMNFREMYILDDTTYNSFEWGSNKKMIRNSIQMDTSKDVNYIWIDLEVECTVPDKFLLPRKDRVLKISLKLDSITISKSLNADLYRDISDWANITIKDIANNTTYYHTNNDFNFLVVVKEEEEGLITCGLLIDFFRIGKYETTGFEGVIELKYK